MNEIKRRKKGFLALLLAAVMILGIPGADLIAAIYYIPGAGNPALAQGDTLNAGDEVRHYSGDVIFNYPDKASTTGSYANTISGGPYIVSSISGLTVNLELPVQTPPAQTTTPTTPSTPAAPVAPVVITPQPDVTNFYSDYLDELDKLIRAIKRPGGEVHGFGLGTSLPYKVLKALADNPEDVLVFTTEYKNVRYTFTIQGGDYINDMITPEIPWYGPLWLAQHFFLTTVAEPLPEIK